MKPQSFLKKSPPKKAPAEKVVKDIRRATRRHFSAEDKIRIVLDGLRGEDSIAGLCSKEGPKRFGPRACITPGRKRSWPKAYEFMEAGKRCLAGDTARAATTGEVQDLRSEARALKETDANGNELTCGTANSFVRQFTYFGATSLPASETVTDGVGAGPLTTTYTYDAAGRQLSADGPLPGTAVATYARYDVLGRTIWEIGPVGENSRRLVTRTTYRAADDKPSKVESGTISSNLNDTAFVLNSQTDIEYNARRLAVKTTVSSGGTAYGITQASYDARNREQCTVVRLTLASPPANACTKGSPNTSNELDRITRKHYDTESRVVRIEQAVDTDKVRDYATYTFTPNGLDL